MSRYKLSILRPTSAEIVALEIMARVPHRQRAVTELNVYEVSVERPLSWVKENADELAAKISKGQPYNALYVEEVSHG